MEVSATSSDCVWSSICWQRLPVFPEAQLGELAGGEGDTSTRAAQAFPSCFLSSGQEEVFDATLVENGHSISLKTHIPALKLLKKELFLPVE